MSRLSDIFVAIRADDRPLQATARHVRDTLTSINKTVVEPRIVVPEKAKADLDALQARMTKLAKQKVSLNVDTATAKAEVDTLGRQLEKLQTSRHSIPLELRGEIDRQIADVERALAVAQRKQTTLPLKLERIDAQLVAVQRQMDSLGELEVPVQLKGLAKVRAQIAKLRGESAEVDVHVKATGSSGEPFDPVKLLKIPALLGAANLAGAALSSLGAGAISLTSAIGPAAGAFAVMPVLLGAVQQGSAVAKIGLSGVTDAMTLQEEHAKKLAAGIKISKNEQLKYDAALKENGPVITAFVTQLIAAKGGLDEVRKSVQAVLLPAFGAAIETISATYLPVLKSQLTGTATALAGVVKAFTAWLTFPGTVAKVTAVLKGNNTLLGILGGVALSLADILLNIWVAALPLTIRFAGWLAKVSDKLATLVEGASKSGALTAFFKDAGDVAAQLGRIFGGLIIGLFNVFSGGREQGQGFLDLFETLTDKFSAWTSSLEGKSAIADFFARAQPVLEEVGRLIADVAKGFGAMSTQGDLAPIISQIRTEFLPAVQAILDSVDDKLLGSLVTLATKGADFFNVISGHSGSLTITVDILNKFADAALWLLNNIPGATQVLGGFFAVMAVKQAASIIGNITGISSVLGFLTKDIDKATLAEKARIWQSKVGAKLAPIFSGALRLVGGAVRFMLGPVGLVITAIGLLIAGFIYAYKHSEKFRAIVDKVVGAFKDGFFAALDGAKRAVESVGDFLVAFAEGFKARVVDPIISAWGSIVGGVTAAWESVKTVVTDAWNAIGAFFSTALGTVTAPISTAFGAIVGVVTTVFSAIATAIKFYIDMWINVIKVSLAVLGTIVLLAFDAIKFIVLTVFSFIKDKIIAPVWAGITTIFSAAQAVISAAWSAFWGGVKTVVSTAWTFVRDKIITPVWSAVKSIFSAAQTVLTTAWGVFWGAIKTAASTAWTFVKDKIITPVWTAVKTIFTNAHKAVKDAFIVFWTAIKTAASTAWNFVKDKIITPVWTALKTIFTNAQKAVKDAFTTFWTAIKTAASTAWTYVKDKIITPVWTTIKKIFTDAQKNVKDAFDTFWKTIKKIGVDAIALVKTNLTTGFDKIKTAISTFVSAAGTLFDKIKAKFSAPIDWVVKHVFEKIRSAYNKVAKLVGLGQIPAFATGGPVPNTGQSTRGGVPVNAADGGSIPKRRAGGRVRGRGGPRQDNIAGIDRKTKLQTSWVSAKEFVVNAKSYAANKGLVEKVNAAKGRVSLEGIAGEKGHERPEGMLFRDGGYIPRLAGGGLNIDGAKKFARSQAGKPYIWAASGPRGYDCSGFMSAITNYLRGRRPYSRVGSTAGFPWGGFKRGVGEFTIGSTSNYAHSGTGHMAGTLGGMNVESRGKRGVLVGGAARGYGDRGFNKVYHLGSAGDFGGGYGGGGGGVVDMIKPRAIFDKTIGKVASNLISKIPDGGTPFGKIVAALPTKLVAGMRAKLPESFGSSEDGGGGGGGGGSVGSGVKRWSSTALKALALTGNPASLLGSLLRRMNQESGGNPRAINNWDSNARAGHPSRGLLQTIPSTFARYRMKSLPNDIYNPLANIVASLRYAKARYGSVSRAYNKKGGYADGGLVELALGGVIAGGRGGVNARIGEGSRDELITPLPRGWNMGGSSNDSIERLIRAIEEHGLGDTSINLGGVYNPLPESPSTSLNSSLQRVAALGLV